MESLDGYRADFVLNGSHWQFLNSRIIWLVLRWQQFTELNGVPPEMSVFKGFLTGKMSRTCM